MRNKILTLAFILASVVSYAQTIEGIVLDKITGTAIQDAHILFENTALQIYTDKEGKYHLPSNTRGKNFVVSHLSYKLTSRDVPLVENLVDTIYLEQAATILQNVVIEDRKNDKLRKKRFEQFKKDLFDSETLSRSLHKKIDILNPEVLLFDQRGDTLFASSNQLIRFRNKYLGYEMQLYLKKYIHTDDLAACMGTVFFDPLELKTINYDRPKLEKRKKEIWRDSEQAFFQNLLLKDININHKYYQRGENGKTYVFRDATQLYDRVFKTRYEGVYAFLTPFNLIIKNAEKESEIGSNTRVVLFNEQGVVLNRNNYFQNGYWLRKSLTETLPHSYCKSIEAKVDSNFDKSYDLATLVSKANDIAYRVKKKELHKIELVSDKLIYSSFENVYVHARILDYQTQQSTAESQLMHIELIDENGLIIKKVTKKIIDGNVSAGFVIESTESMKYCIRAYTDYMRSFGTEHYGYCTIAVNMVQRASISSTDTINIQYHPEGNSIVSGRSNRILFNITDKYERPTTFSGHIFDKGQDTTYVLKTLNDGTAAADIYFDSESHFTFLAEDTYIQHSLNDFDRFISEAGIQVLDRNKYFRINVLKENTDRKYKLQLFQHGKLLHREYLLADQSSVKIEKSFLPLGDILIVLRSGATDKILSHRYVENIKAEKALLTLRSEYEYHYVGQPINVNVSNLHSDTLEWNIRVVNDEYLDQNESTKNKYLNHIKLIERPIEPMEEMIISNTIPNGNAKSDMTIKGHVTLAGTDTAVEAYVSINSWSEDFYIEGTTSDAEGNFQFENVPYFENKPFLIQARILDEDNENPIEGDRGVDVHIHPIDSLVTDYRMDALPHLAKAKNQLIDSIDQVNFKNEVTLNEVNIKARAKKQSHNYNNVNIVSKVDWIADDISLITVLYNLYPGISMRPNPEAPSEYVIFVRFPVDDFVPLVVIVNGAAKSASALHALRKGQVYSMSLYKGVLSIITYPNYKTKEELEAEKQGILVYQFPETQDSKDYSKLIAQITDGSNLDQRSTIYWNTNLQTPANQSEDISFIASQKEGNYTLIATTYHPEYGKVEQRYPIVVKARE